jgi:antitoxin YefM
MFCDKEVSIMLNTNITQFRKNVFAMLENTIKYNEPINISTKSGNAILLSEEEYNGIMATLELSSNAELKKTLIDGMNTPLSECIPEDEVVW